MRRLALAIAAPLLLSGCISVHPPELPRAEGHGHGGTALHSDCGGCGQVLADYLQRLLTPPAKPIAPAQNKQAGPPPSSGAPK